MMEPISGIHHITAVATDSQRNLDFYTDVLGLRLVKRTVNFDDPGTYHLYYGDDEGRPGTILTFFPWAKAGRGIRGAGQATAISFSVAEGALTFWHDRLRSRGVACETIESRLDEEVLALLDPDGLQLELVAHSGARDRPGQSRDRIDEPYSIRGFHGTTLSLANCEPTAELLGDTLGLRAGEARGGRIRLVAGEGPTAACIDLVEAPDAAPGRIAGGSVHHLAWRAPNDEAQLAWREKLAAHRPVTEVRDRQYFRSVYFHEPGGVLFEIATDGPGFTYDEPLDELGKSLKLPPWLEPQRGQIERVLPRLDLPGRVTEPSASPPSQTSIGEPTSQ